MNSLLIILIVVFVFVGLSELVASSVYGKIIKNKDIPVLDNYVLNILNTSIMLNHKDRGRTFISSGSGAMLTKYYVNGIGRVWRWSEGHKMIENKFKELKQISIN